MESLPDELWREPQPVLALQGELDTDPDIHERVIRSLHTISLDHQNGLSGGGPLSLSANGGGGGGNAVAVPFRFLSVPTMANFPVKKAIVNELRASDGRPLEGFTIRGILKTHWMHKHVMEIPSVALYIGGVDLGWSVPEWGVREKMLVEGYERLRAQLGPRDIKIILVLIRRGFGDEREFDDRIMNLRRRANLDTKMLYIMNDPQDLLPTALSMRRLYKHVRDLSCTFYLNHCKRVKRWETSLNRASQLSLIVRYRYKQAFWYEFLGNVEKALKHYRRAFESLLEMHTVIVSHAGGDGRQLSMSSSGGAGHYQLSSAQLLGGWASQVKAVAEYVNFKICYYFMREALHADAVTQFRQMMQHWLFWPRGSSSIGGGGGGSLDLLIYNDEMAPAPSPNHRLDFLHFEWISKQYQIFGDLLQRFPSPQFANFATTTGGSGPIGMEVADTYADPDHYILNAAIYTAKRRNVARFLSQNPRTDSKYAARVNMNFGIKGPLLRSPYFVGGRKQFVDPTIEEGMVESDLIEMIQLILEKAETELPLAQVLIGLLKDAVLLYDPSRPFRPRFKALQHLLLANQLSKAQAFGEAWEHYCGALRKYDMEREGGWNNQAVLVLLRARHCAFMLGKQAAYLDLTLKLLSHELRSMLPPDQRCMLFLEVLYIISGLSEIPECDIVKAQQGLVGFFGPQFGQYANQVIDKPETNANAPLVEGLDSSASSLSSPAVLDPMVTVQANAIEVVPSCGFRQLLSYSLTFPEPTAAMGQASVINLRIVSHFPLRLHLTSLEVRFNKDYVGTIVLVDDQPLSPIDRLRQSMPTTPQQQLPKKMTLLQIDETKVARTRLVLEPDTPLDIYLSIMIPTHELVEVGDMLYALQLKLIMNMPDSMGRPGSFPSYATPFARPLCFIMSSGVVYLDNLGVVAADICEQGTPPENIVASQCSTLPVPLQASVRGFPAVEVTRPIARASVELDMKVGADGVVNTLVEHMCCIWLKIQSHEDALAMPMLYVRSDPPPVSNRPEDAFFFEVMTEEGVHVPVKLGKDLQPEAAMRILGDTKTTTTTIKDKAGHDLMVPNEEVWLPIWLRTTREGHTKINMVLVYHSVEGDGKAITRCNFDLDQYSNLMVSSEYTIDVQSYAPFQTTFEVASPTPIAISAASQAPPLPPPSPATPTPPPTPTTPAMYTFFTGDEVVMRTSIKAIPPPDFNEAIPYIHQVIWYAASDTPPGTIATLTKESSQPLTLGVVAKAGGRVIHTSSCSHGMLLQEILGLTFHFLCPEKESSHPISLGHVGIYWKMMPNPSAASTKRGVKEEEEEEAKKMMKKKQSSMIINKDWMACTEIPCPSVTVIKPELAVDMQAPAEAKLGQAFSLQWSIKNLANHVIAVRLLITDGGAAGGGDGGQTQQPQSGDDSLVWGGMKESVVQVLPHTSVLVPYEMVPLTTGPLALPRLNLSIVSSSAAVAAAGGSDKGSSGSIEQPVPTPARISYRYLENSPLAAASAPPPPPSSTQTSAEASLMMNKNLSVRHIFVLPPDETYHPLPPSMHLTSSQHK